MQSVFDKGFLSLSNRYLTWKINDFHTLPLIVGCEVRSPQFVYGNSGYTLVIWPRGQKSTDSEEWFGICLFKYDAPASNDCVEFSIVNELGTIKTCTVKCSQHNIFRQERFIEWSDFCALSHKLVPNDCLTIVCRLPMEYREGRTRNENITQMLNDPISMTKSVKFGNPDTQVSSFAVSGPDCSSSTINSFFSTSSRENSFDFAPDSAETQYTDFKMSDNVRNGSNPGNKIWSYFSRGRSRDSKRITPDVVLDSAGGTPENSTSQSDSTSEADLPENYNSSRSSCSSESKSADSVRVNSNVLLSRNTSASSVGEKDYDRTAQNQPLPNNSTFQVLFTNSTANSSLNPNQPVQNTSSAVHFPKGLKVLSEHLKNMYLAGNDFDLTIIMEGKEFKVLRSLLKSRSPVFLNMLTEDTSNIISISPFDACNSSIFHDFLLYVYTGVIETLSHKNVYGLYSAACKFEMPELKEQCVKFLKVSLSIDTVTDILHFVYDEPDLLEIAIFFLAKNLEVIMDTDEFKQFMLAETNRALQYHHKALQIGYTKTIT